MHILCDYAVAVRCCRSIESLTAAAEVPKWKVETSDCRSDTATAALAATGPRAGRSPLPQIHITNPQRQKNKRPSAHQPSGLLPGPADSRSRSVHTARVHIPRIPCLLSREMDGADGVEMRRCFPLPRNAWADDQIQCWAESRSTVGVILHLVPPFFFGFSTVPSNVAIAVLCAFLCHSSHLASTQLEPCVKYDALPYTVPRCRISMPPRPSHWANNISNPKKLVLLFLYKWSPLLQPPSPPGRWRKGRPSWSPDRCRQL